ncbi:hypothetical protein Hanom_Chr03g00220871 [Helianthus anomalus]
MPPLFFHLLPLNPNFSFISYLFPSPISFSCVQSFINLILITIPFHLLHIFLLLHKVIQSRSTALRSLTPFDPPHAHTFTLTLPATSSTIHLSRRIKHLMTERPPMRISDVVDVRFSKGLPLILMTLEVLDNSMSSWSLFQSRLRTLRCWCYLLVRVSDGLATIAANCRLFLSYRNWYLVLVLCKLQHSLSVLNFYTVMSVSSIEVYESSSDGFMVLLWIVAFRDNGNEW